MHSFRALETYESTQYSVKPYLYLPDGLGSKGT
jgi:hypothetical protein